LTNSIHFIEIENKKRKEHDDDAPEKKISKFTTKKVDISNIVPITELENGYLELEKMFLEDSGLFCANNLIIYPREDYTKEVEFLKEEVMKNSQWGWILGPPGTGKSITTYAFLLDLIGTKQWKITWIHLSRRIFPQYVQFHENYKESGTIDDRERLMRLLDFASEGNHIVVIDGFADLVDHNAIIKDCYAWFSQNIVLHRLTVLCSMSSRGKTNIQDDKNQRVNIHNVNSWKIEEYHQAMKNNVFFESIREFLDGSLDLEVTPQELIDSKYYFAGGSSRFMFCLKTNEVVDLLDQSVEVIHDALPYIQGTIGDQSNFVVNRLFSIFKKEGSRTQRTIVSEYAASQLAMKMGRKLVENFYQTLRSRLNPSMDGWLLEMWFFAALSEEGVTVYNSSQNKEVTWPQSDILNFDPNQMNLDLFKSSPVWLKPLKWCQGGYDAVYVDMQKNLLKFVQITRSSTHSFKLNEFAIFLQNFKKVHTKFDVNGKETTSIEVKALEIYFLVPKKTVREFQINYSQISGMGQLEDLVQKDWGWKKGHEHKQVKVRGIQGFDQ
jgi:hypothetical protein